MKKDGVISMQILKYIKIDNFIYLYIFIYNKKYGDKKLFNFFRRGSC